MNKRSKNSLSPLVIVALIVLIGMSAFNFWRDYSSKVLSKTDVEQAVIDFIQNNPEKLADANLQLIMKEFMEDNKEDILKLISAESFDEKIYSTVDTYIKGNAEVIIAAVEQHQRGLTQQKQQEAIQNISQKSEELENDPNSPTSGNVNGDITVVEFFDYNCGYCKRSLGNITKLLEEDKNVKVVFKEMPILSENSMLASKYALAVNQVDPSKYVDYHAKLMSSRGQSSKEQLIKFAEEIGVDTVAVQAVVESSAIMQAIQNNQELARSVGISGTPAFIIGGQLVPGAIDYDEFKRIIKERRAMNNS